MAKVFIDSVTGTWGLAEDIRIVDTADLFDAYTTDDESVFAFFDSLGDSSLAEWADSNGARLNTNEVL